MVINTQKLKIREIRNKPLLLISRKCARCSQRLTLYHSEWSSITKDQHAQLIKNCVQGIKPSSALNCGMPCLFLLLLWMHLFQALIIVQALFQLRGSARTLPFPLPSPLALLIRWHALLRCEHIIPYNSWTLSQFVARSLPLLNADNLLCARRAAIKNKTENRKPKEDTNLRVENALNWILSFHWKL